MGPVGQHVGALVPLERCCVRSTRVPSLKRVHAHLIECKNHPSRERKIKDSDIRTLSPEASLEGREDVEFTTETTPDSLESAGPRGRACTAA